MKLVLQLKQPLKNPVDGSGADMVAGDFDVSDSDLFVAQTEYGKVKIERQNVFAELEVSTDIDMDKALQQSSFVRVLN